MTPSPKRAPRIAAIPCTKPHFWCQQHDTEVCSVHISIHVRHKDCTLSPLPPHPKEPAP